MKAGRAGLFPAASGFVPVFIGCASDSCLQPANDPDTIVLKDFLLMRGVREFAGEVLGGEMQLFMQVCVPPGAIGHIINHPITGDPLAGTALAGIAAQFREGNEAGGDVHGEVALMWL